MKTLKERVIAQLIATKNADEKVLHEMEEKFSSFLSFRENLIKENIATEEEILLILAHEYKMPYFDLDKYKIPQDNKDLLSKEIAFRYNVIPVSKIGEVLTLATSNPLDIIAFEDLKLTTSFKRIDLVLAQDAKIVRHLNRLYSDTEIGSLIEEEDGDDDDDLVREVEVKEEVGLESLVKESNLPPVVRVVDLIVYEGLSRRASDIHIEPKETELSVRYRIDGVLHHGLSLPARNQSAVLARMKVMSGLDITEFRVPQDGRFKVKFEGREIDFRVSSLPTQFGEKIVLRVLDKESLSLGLKTLGFSDKPLELFEEGLTAPFGIILVTGPTGSGKSTTLYSVINQINTPEKNIITIEDPVEYQLEGITQIHVKSDIGLTFASSLRCVLRQSPDVIMVGEIRDGETADIAIKASLTGHLMFSTLHTNNSVGAITRLIDMGTEPFLVSASLIATTAQRLVRRLCPKCKLEREVNVQMLEKIGFPAGKNKLFEAQGCRNCNQTGYRGRIALLEVLSFDDTIREMIVKRASEDEIVNHARQNRGYATFKENGFQKCINGHTTVEEVLRVAG